MVPLARIGVVPCAKGVSSKAPRSIIDTPIIFLIFSSPFHLGTCLIAPLLGAPPGPWNLSPTEGDIPRMMAKHPFRCRWLFNSFQWFHPELFERMIRLPALQISEDFLCVLVWREDGIENTFNLA